MPLLPAFVDYRLACSCVYLWLYTFSLFILAVELTNFFVLVLIFCGPTFTYWLIKKYSIPLPDESFVREIFGREYDGEFIGPDSISKVVDSEPNDFIMTVIAHRFAGIEAPENSLEALDLCYKNGAVAVEFDLVLTADYVPVIFHDPDMERITDICGDIREKTWSELKSIDISIKHPLHEKFIHSQIPLYDDVIKKCIDYDLRFFIDVKDDRPEVVKIILETYEKYPKMYRRCIVSSFDAVFLYNVRRANPDIVSSMAWRPCYMSCYKYSIKDDECVPYTKFLPLFCCYRILDHLSSWIFHHLAAYLIGFSAVLLCKDCITPQTVLFWKLKNVRVFAWTVNNNLEKLHLLRNLGVGYFTDSMLQKP